MPARPPKTDKWTARENTHGKRVLLIVSGLVQVTNTNKDPILKEARPGINPKILILDLTIKSGAGPGLDVLVWKRATFSKVVRVGQFDSVDVHWDGDSVAIFPVHSDDEYHEHHVKLTQAANAKYAKPKAKGKPAPTEPKPAPKKAKPKPKPKPKPKLKAKPKPKPKPKPKLKAKAKPKPKSKPKAKAAAKRAPKAKSKPKPKPKAGAKKKRSGGLSGLLRAVRFRRK
jgi:hypothetical protein